MSFKRLYIIKYLFCALFFAYSFCGFSEERAGRDSALYDAGIIADSLEIPADTSSIDTSYVTPAADTVENKEKGGGLKDIVEYQATDSMIFFNGNIGRLYGDSKVVYGTTSLESGFIQMNMDSSVIYATGVKDSSGVMSGYPVFTDNSGKYESKKVIYDYETEKGIISGVVTQQGEGYVTGNKTKKINEDEFCMVDGKYTTCDKVDDPHFYLALSKAKVKPHGYIVSGPAHLVVEDVNLPLFIPFGYFPINSGVSSGILSPSYGDDLSRGFYLKDFGYYFAFNDYVDLALTGEFYTKGSWGIKARSRYRKRYKYSGNLNASFLETVNSEKYLPDYSKYYNASVVWSHTQDAKANPYRSFSASVNFQTSGYTRSDLNSYYNASAFAASTKSSTVNMTQRFPNSPFTISMSGSVTQSSRDSLVSVSFPSLRVSMSTITPFKRKNKVGDEKWYEKIRVGYTASMSNSINRVKEYDFFEKNIIKDWKNGIQHSVPVSATFSVLKNINLTPSLSYRERWYSSHINKSYDEVNNTVVSDTVWGFNRVWDYSASVSASTKLYGMYRPWAWLFGNKISRIRHVLTPTVSFSYHPDFSSSFYGYYGTYSYENADGDMVTQRYSKYSNSLYGVPGAGKSGSIGLSIANNLEMKVRQVTDTSDTYKKVSLIDNLSFSTSYNLAADSLNWSNISTSIRLKFGKNYSLSLSGALDPYTYALDKSGNPYKTNTTQWKKNKIIGKLISTGTSFSYTFSNKMFSKKKKDKNGKKSDKENESSDSGVHVDKNGFSADGGLSGGDGSSSSDTGKDIYDPESNLYQDFKLPWSLSVNYSLRYRRSTFNKEKLEYNHKFSHNLSFSGNISLTDNWKFSASTSYNFQQHKLTTMNCTVYRDLHCWEITGSFIPIGNYKSYNITIRVKSSILKDLKYEQHQNPYDNTIW